MQKNKLVILLSFCLMVLQMQAQQTIVQYLSGTDKDHTINWDFLCTKGRNSGIWTTIPVPSNWEMQGFGSYNYYKDNNDPEQGFYKYKFKVPSIYRNKRIIIVFEACMTDAEAKINGKPVGAIHQGGFYEFKYDVTDLIQFNKQNLLEVTVSRHSSNASVNQAERKADFWLFGGIYRPVYLEIVPSTYIERVAIDAKANGDFNLHVFANNIANKQTIETQVEELNGEIVEKPFSQQGNDSNILIHHFNNIKTWNPEQPNLYNAIISIKENGKIIHTVKQRFGFRTAELRLHDGFYVNGVKVVFKGVNRHSEWPETGRTLNRDIHLMDIGLMKEMNMNAVRMSHYPPDKEFLDLCDSLGLFVLDELTGWQAAYDTTVGRKLVRELVIRDVNHPSIVIWDNGNEGGWNRALDNDYQLYDPQKRLVIHPWEQFNGTNTKHYPDFKYIQNEVANGKDVFFPTEFMHGLFDGGQGAALDDFWNEMMKHPHAAGGFLWSFHDEGIVRSDKNNAIDVAGNQAPDGILGPHREKEGSFYTIKEIWSPIQIATKILPADFDGKLPVENRYLFTNLNQCRFQWKLVKFPPASMHTTGVNIISKGMAAPISLLPNEKGMLSLNMDRNFSNADALYLTAYDAAGKEVLTRSWAIHTPKQIAEKAGIIEAKNEAINTNDNAMFFTITCDGITYDFNKKNGFLQKVFNGKNDISFSGGPALAGIKQMLNSFKYYKQGDVYVIEASYNDDSLYVKWVFQTGQLPMLDYSYKVRDTTDFMGITFNYPEEKINGMQWLGHGPYRVWKNRLKGQQLGIWQKKYNNTITGESWNYPEFKGWHSDLYWVTIQNKESDFTVYTKNANVYLEMLQPAKPKAAGNENTSPPFPEGNIGFMNGISAMGTKFQKAEIMGPQSGKNIKTGNEAIRGSLYFDFR